MKSLLAFVTTSELFERLCGGVHILDFLTQEPDLYSSILPLEWRAWFEQCDISAVLDLLLREDVAVLEKLRRADNIHSNGSAESASGYTWPSSSIPPQSIVDYVLTIRKHVLVRDFTSHDKMATIQPLPRHVAVGMKPKKVHEVQHFARYINDLSTDIASSSLHQITHLVDFGSGQNYLGRTLASPPYNKHVVALESKEHNIRGARSMDITAKLARKEMIIRNKKEYRRTLWTEKTSTREDPKRDDVFIKPALTAVDQREPPVNGVYNEQDTGGIHYVETMIQDGNLSKIMPSVLPTEDPASAEPQLMVVSLHSCGNLLHHGLRSLSLNPAVKAVAMVGCCYNLVTERLGPPTHKLSSFRTSNSRLESTSCACDPHGFPMSERLAGYTYKQNKGIRFNITARMMACQAPHNWTADECESFFTRHFYRALLQRMFLDRGVFQKSEKETVETSGDSPKELTGVGPAITIGSLRKGCYTSFTDYVRGATMKMVQDHDHGERIAESMMRLKDEEIQAYEENYGSNKKNLSIVWSLMAFSASVVESVIVVDRWLYLKEQAEVKDCWVEPAFDYAKSPRNLVVVGVKK